MDVPRTSDAHWVAAKMFSEAAKLAYATKSKECVTSRKIYSRDFWRISNSVLNNGKAAALPLFNGLEVLSYVSDKAKLLAKNFSNNSYLDDSGISLLAFPSRTNLKLHVAIAFKMIKMVITILQSFVWSWLYSSGGSKELRLPELSYIPAELFNMCLKESCFPDCWKVSLLVHVFKNVGERSIAKHSHYVRLLSMVSKVFE